MTIAKNGNTPCYWGTLPVSSKSSRAATVALTQVEPLLRAKPSSSSSDKDLIVLARGDGTAAGNLKPCPVAVDTIRQLMSDPGTKYVASYANSCGTTAVRQAIAAYHSHPVHVDEAADAEKASYLLGKLTIKADDVIVANGVTGSLELALGALLEDTNNPDDRPDSSILLLPQPCLPLYQVIAESHGAKVAYYRLQSTQKWQCDFDELEEILTQYDRSRIRGILINNPGNPTGAVYSKQHLLDLVAFCHKHQLPIVTDECYGDMTFGGGSVEDAATDFYPMAQIAAEYAYQQGVGTVRVPVITTSSLAKQFLLPGWRVGWVAFHDNEDQALREVQAGTGRLAQLLLGASHLAMSAVPPLLDPTNNAVTTWKQTLHNTLQDQSQFMQAQLQTIPGLQVVPAQGTMHLMVMLEMEKFHDNFFSDVAFCERLQREEQVLCTPGTYYGYSNSVCVDIFPPTAVLEEAANRIRAFCSRYTAALSSSTV